MQALLEVKSVLKTFDSVTAVNGVSFSVAKGEFVGIMGSSGSGKSTLLNLIATIDTASSGKISIDGKDISTLNESQMADFRKDSLGFVFQDYNLLDTLTLREKIALALIIRKTCRKEMDDHIDAIAKRLGIYEVLEKYPYEVSGGQRQRCACVRAIAVSPKLILADEPTGALDSHSAKSLMETFVQLISGILSYIRISRLQIGQLMISSRRNEYCLVPTLLLVLWVSFVYAFAAYIWRI